ncbi:MAG: restriction endonuclease subunit S [Lachnospiraceae bacterium]
MKSDWNCGTLSDVCKVITDGSHYSPNSVEYGRYMVSVKDFTEFGFDFSKCRQISEHDYITLKKNGCIPQHNDILVGKDGARYFEDVIIYRQSEEPALLSSIAILRCDEDKVIPDFLYYMFKNPLVKKNVKDNYGSGSAIPRIVLKDFRRMIIRYPSVQEQYRIISVLNCIDQKIQLNTKINNHLEQQFMAIFDYFSSTTAEHVCTLSELIDIRDGTHDSPKSAPVGYHLVTSKHLLPYGVDVSVTNLISEEDYIKINERSKVDPGDILISMIGTVGLISYVFDNPVEFAIKNVGLFKTSQAPMIALYILGYLKDQHTSNHIERHLAGSTQKYISLGELRKMPIRIPSDSNLVKYNQIVEPIISQITLLVEENRKLLTLRDTLLPKLMSGELDVSDIDF